MYGPVSRIAEILNQFLGLASYNIKFLLGLNGESDEKSLTVPALISMI